MRFCIFNKHRHQADEKARNVSCYFAQHCVVILLKIQLMVIMKTFLCFIMVFKWSLIPFFSLINHTNYFFEKNNSIPVHPQDSVTKKIIEHHFSAFKENDLESILSDYSEQSIIFTPDSAYKGLKKIQSFFSQAFCSFPKDQTTIIIDKFITNGNLGYVVWHGETPKFIVSFSTATYIINKGKIIRHTIGRVTKQKD